MMLYKQYLLEWEILVRTDHAGLTRLQKTPEMMGNIPNGRSLFKNSLSRFSTDP